MRPSRFRFWLLGLLISASFLNYLDRQTVSVLKTTLKAAFAIDDAHYALLLNVFMGLYAVAYLGSGWLVDRWGPRFSLTLFASLWSAATVGCGLARNFAQMIGMQGLLGLAEAGFQPVSVRAGAAWAPPEGRGLFLTLCGVGSSLGAIAAPPLVIFLSLYFHWQLAFVLPGLLGFVVAALWWATYRDPVAVVAQEEKGELPALSWPQLWRTRSLWGMLLVRFLTDPVWYFCLFWLPGYLQESKGATLSQVGLWGWLPFVTGNVGGIGLAMLSDFLARRSGDRLRSRKRLLIVLAAAGPLCMLVPHAPGMGATLALFCMITVVCSGWLYLGSPIIADAFPLGNVASVWGICGAFGAVGAMIFNYVVGHALLEPRLLFIVMGLLHPCAAVILYSMVRRVKTAL